MEFKITSHLEHPQTWEKGPTGSLINSKTWAEVLENAFKLKPVYLTVNDQHQILMPVFIAGSFKIGYVGFPILYTKDGPLLCDAFFRALQSHKYPMGIDLLKISVSAFSQNQITAPPNTLNPETEIEDLQKWDMAHLHKNISRDIKHAVKQDTSLKNSKETEYNEQIYGLYSKTIARKQGTIKYNNNYFLTLFNKSKISNDILFLVASKNNQTIGFGVFIKDRSMAFYLHGGIDIDSKQTGISDLIVFKGISWAKETGALAFNFMASPPHQQSLIRYKEKWGGVTKELKNYEIVIKPGKATLFKISLKLFNLINQFKSR